MLGSLAISQRTARLSESLLCSPSKPLLHPSPLRQVSEVPWFQQHRVPRNGPSCSRNSRALLGDLPCSDVFCCCLPLTRRFSG